MDDEIILDSEPQESSDDIDEQIDDIDEQLVELLKETDSKNNRILEEITKCQNRLEVLSSLNSAENPLLTEIRLELRNLKDELTSLKLFMDLKLNLPSQKSSEEMATEIPASDIPSQERSTEDPSGAVENKVTEKPAKKTRFA